jgi:tRNA 2-thiocytidine biosynthesis protein TtcA
MFYIHEEDIIRFASSNGIAAMNCGCVVAAEKTSSKRREMKELIKELKKTNKEVDSGIFNAARNVNMDSILGWQRNGKKYSFLDFYDDEGLTHDQSED